MKNNKKLIPELRFPEFENEGEWEIKTLSGICDITNGKANAQDHVDNGRYPLFDRSEVIKASDEFIFDCEAVIIPGEGMRFIPKYYEGKFNLHQRAYALKDFSCSGQFVYYSMLHRSTLLSQKAVQSTVLSLRLPILQDFPIGIPKKPEEQEKIASCLSSLDEVIEAHSQKLELLKDHKKGLMQNLFPQEGEKVPKYRFKEFEKDGIWVKKRLGDLGHFLGGGTPSRSNDAYWIGNIPWISSSDIKEDDIHNISISQYINENAIIESATKIIPKGSILFVSRVGVGKLAINNEELCTSQDFTSFIPAGVLNLFVAYYYSANKNALQSLSQGTSIKGFSKSDLEDSKILYPKNPKEQQKIAWCLSSLDELIKEQAEKIEQLKLHKKGLMQGLFPKNY